MMTGDGKLGVTGPSGPVSKRLGRRVAARRIRRGHQTPACHKGRVLWIVVLRKS